MANKYPLHTEIAYQDASELFNRFAENEWAIFLDSADALNQMEDTNRYSYLCVDPAKTFTIKDEQLKGASEPVTDPFVYLNAQLTGHHLASIEDLPPFQGGAVGYFSYDLCHYLENIQRPILAADNPYPDMAIGLYDVVVAFDHVLKKAHLISTGYPFEDESQRMKHAQTRLDAFQKLLAGENELGLRDLPDTSGVELKSPFSKDGYESAVAKAQKYILEGDIFEVNLSHRFTAKLSSDPSSKYALYTKMRSVNASPFCAYLNLPDHQILSTSPERFLSLNGQKVSTRPIKGTCPRGKTDEEDVMLANRLAASEKDRSENIMIVDLLRNDLSQVCEKESVTVQKLCGIESYPTVHHLVSTIEGNLRPTEDALSLLRACFPGGSITGAPKVRSMQIIYELEPTARGPYCGSIGYVGFNGNMDTSIVIRTLLCHGENISYQAGGAVVLDSEPENEYLETLVKSHSVNKALSSEVLA